MLRRAMSPLATTLALLILCCSLTWKSAEGSPVTVADGLEDGDLPREEAGVSSFINTTRIKESARKVGAFVQQAVVQAREYLRGLGRRVNAFFNGEDPRSGGCHCTTVTTPTTTTTRRPETTTRRPETTTPVQAGAPRTARPTLPPSPASSSSPDGRMSNTTSSTSRRTFAEETSTPSSPSVSGTTPDRIAVPRSTSGSPSTVTTTTASSRPPTPVSGSTVGQPLSTSSGNAGTLSTVISTANNEPAENNEVNANREKEKNNRVPVVKSSDA